MAATHVNAPTGLIGYLSQTAEQLLAEERSKTEPDPVSEKSFWVGLGLVVFHDRLPQSDC